ncbi:hypothetical protein EGW08_013785, partial [Elysia chlorotica]
MDREVLLYYDKLNRTDAISLVTLGKETDDIDDDDNAEEASQWEPPTLPSYISIYVPLANILIFLVGTIGNSMVIVVVARVRDMRSNINLYLVNLSVADLLVLLVCQPSALLEFYAKERWFLGRELCLMVPVLEHTVVHASALTVVVITFERYLAICRPHSRFRLSTNCGFSITILCIWICATLTSLPFLDMTSLDQSTFYDGSTCEVCRTVMTHKWHLYFVVVTTTGFSVLPVVLLACFYVPIICRLRARQWTGEGSGRVSLGPIDSARGRYIQRSAALSSCGYRLRTHRQVIRMLILIVVFLFFSLVPMRAMVLWQTLGPPDVIANLGIENYYNIIWICRMLIFTNSAVNPLIYSLLSTRFKIAFR